MRRSARSPTSRQKPGGGKNDSPPQASEGAPPCHHFNFELLASRTVGEYTSIVLSHLVCAVLLRQPQETCTLTSAAVGTPRPLGACALESWVSGVPGTGPVGSSSDQPLPLTALQGGSWANKRPEPSLQVSPQCLRRLNRRMRQRARG